MLMYWSLNIPKPLINDISSDFPSALQDVESAIRAAFIWQRSCVQSHSSIVGGCKKQTGRQWSWQTSILAWTGSQTRESKKLQLDWRIPSAIWKLSSESFSEHISSLQFLLGCVGRAVCYNTSFFFFFVSLSHCGLTDDCCAELASGCASQESIISALDLSCNNLQDKGVRKLCVGLKSPQCKLEKLS